MHKLPGAFPPEPRDNPLKASARVLGLYARATLLITASEAVLYGIGFAVARVPLWPLLAILCALAGLIPRIGSVIGIAIVLFADWIGDGGWTGLTIALGTWLVVQAIEGFWLTPRLMGKPLGLKPVAVFLALICGSLLFGPLGLFLAIPVLAIALVWVRYFRGRRLLP